MYSLLNPLSHVASNCSAHTHRQIYTISSETGKYLQHCYLPNALNPQRITCAGSHTLQCFLFTPNTLAERFSERPAD